MWQSPGGGEFFKVEARLEAGCSFMCFPIYHSAKGLFSVALKMKSQTKMLSENVVESSFILVTHIRMWPELFKMHWKLSKFYYRKPHHCIYIFLVQLCCELCMGSLFPPFLMDIG